MTIKEITALRKSGKLQDALDAAETEFEKVQNVYTAGALFWCLYDLSKSQVAEELEDSYNRMKSLYQDICPGDEYMQKSLSYVENRLVPHYQEIRDAVESVKNGGNAVDFYKIFSNYYDNKELDSKLFSNYGWLIYYALKQACDTGIVNRNDLLNRYLELNLERPSILHSRILSEAVSTARNDSQWFDFADFVERWGLDNLRSEDWDQYPTKEGNTLPSLVEKMIGVYAKEIRSKKYQPSEEFCKILDEALTRYPKSQNMPYFKATILIEQGRIDEAISYYRGLILRFPSKAYLWSHLSGLVDDIDTGIGFLCKAVNSGDKEEFLSNSRLRLASKLIDKGLYANAKTELDKYYETFLSNGWHLKQSFMDLAHRIPQGTRSEDNSDLYSEYFKYADQFIYSDLPSEYAIKVDDRNVEDRNKPGKKFLQWKLLSGTKEYFLKRPHRLGLKNKTPNGTAFEIKEQNGKIVWIKQVEEMPALPWCRTIHGMVDIRIDKKGNRYAIVDRVYVRAKLLEGLETGDFIKVIAVPQKDGRWTAISAK